MSHGLMKTANEALACKSSMLHCYSTERDPLGSSEDISRKASPLLNRFYYYRYKILHKMVSSCISAAKQLHNRPQFLILGAGLDFSYEDRNDCDVFVVDFETVLTARKLKAPPYASHTRYVAGDLNDFDLVLNSLRQNGFNCASPTVVLIECVLSYIDSQNGRKLLGSLSQGISRSCLVMYDPVFSSTDAAFGFGQMMHHMFQERGAPLLGLQSSLTEIGELLIGCQWNHVNCCTIAEARNCYLSPEERVAVHAIDQFDEFASLCLLQNSYAVVLASTQAQLMKLAFNSLCCWSKSSEATMTNTAELIAHKRLQLETRLIMAERRINLAAMPRRVKQGSYGNGGSITVKIRKSSRKDTNELVRIYETVFAPYCELYKPVKKFIKFSTKNLKVCISESGNISNETVLVAFEITNESKLLGCIRLHWPIDEGAERRSEITHFCVESSTQNRGVGKELLKEALKTAKSIGVESVHLSVLKDLVAARRLYESMGFALVREENLGGGCVMCYFIMKFMR